jgi:hypothetical protein
MSDEISPQLAEILKDAIHDEKVFRRLQTEFDKVTSEYGLDEKDKTFLRNAMERPAAFDVDLITFLNALHKVGFVKLSWVGFRRH